MLNTIRQRIRQGHRTGKFPREAPELPARFKGLPVIDASKCGRDCHSCAEACPAGAIACSQSNVRLDLGACIFCGCCERACPAAAIHFTRNHVMAAGSRSNLYINSADQFAPAPRLRDELFRLFGRSLRLRQVSAGGCNACEADTNVLTTLVFDLSRFGIQFVASPRHADGLLVTGPVTKNMELALLKSYEATPPPKIVIAVGACAISGGMFCNHGERCNGVCDLLPVDLFVPGCPPHPYTILDGLLRLLGVIAQ